MTSLGSDLLGIGSTLTMSSFRVTRRRGAGCERRPLHPSLL